MLRESFSEERRQRLESEEHESDTSGGLVSADQVQPTNSVHRPKRHRIAHQCLAHGRTICADRFYERLTLHLCPKLFTNLGKFPEELVGELAIGPGSFASGTRVEQWMSVCDQPNQQIRMWHKLDYFPSKS